jgi:hypothetical protein
MERVSENYQPCEQPDKVENQYIAVNIKALHDMFKGMFEKFEKKISENIGRKMSENNKELKNYIRADNERLIKESEMNNQKLREEFSEKVELNEKFEKLTDEMDEKVNMYKRYKLRLKTAQKKI